jgi:tripartite-type tricarboxylate transporter receptor subunit TctC
MNPKTILSTTARRLGALCVCLAVAPVVSVAPLAAAAEWPTKAVRIVVPFSPGGATDVVARTLGSRLSEVWKQPVVVENRPGAGGNIGGDLVAKAEPDGHTLLVSSPAEIAINQHLYSKMPYDPLKDLVPVSKLASAPLVLVVHPSVPSKTVSELIAHIRTSGGIAYASSGSGGPQHLAGEQFRLMTGLPMTHVPYKGGAPAITDLVGGQVQMFFAGLPPALPHIKADRLRPLAVTTAKRSDFMPELPSVAEAGLAGFDFENWQGLFAPGGTPPELVERIARDVARAAAGEGFAEQLRASGAGPAIVGPAEFAKFVRSESDKYEKLVKASGARVD